MPRIAPESVEAVRRAADLVELVRGRTQVVRRGGRFWARCPFHDERTPSFCLIPPENDRYYCYGCGATGDAITWMREQEGAAGFGEAVEALAERFGVELRHEQGSPEEEARRASAERRLALLERAAAFYAGYLWAADECAPARDYLLGRGFDEALLRRFRVGYAPAGGSVLIRRAMEQGFTRDQLAEAGLARLRGAGAADFFAGRITFPISDRRGRVQGFGARTLDPAERAKYVNSPEGPGFRKRDLLFGLDLARATGARQGWVAVAEGYTDVMGLVASGVENAVACMGTSLTGAQMRALTGVAPQARLCFDADRAGEEAAWRTVEAGAGVPLELRAVRLPPGRDPGDLAGDGAGRAELRSAVERAEPPARPTRERCEREITALFARFPDSAAKDEASRLAVSLLGLSRTRADAFHAAAAERRPAARGGPPAAARERPGREEALERDLLALALAQPGVAPEVLAELPDGALSTPELGRVAGLIVRGDPVESWPDELTALAGELCARAADVDPSEPALREAAYRVQEQALERRVAGLRARGDEAEALRALTVLQHLRTASRGGG